MRYYLAGPMSNIPKCNFPAFDDAAKKLRAKGYDIVSPSELDSPKVRRLALRNKSGKPAATPTWGTFLARDVKIVADKVKAIILLPGWEKSRGATLEALVGLMCKHSFYLYNGGDLMPLSSERVWRRVAAFGL